MKWIVIAEQSRFASRGPLLPVFCDTEEQAVREAEIMAKMHVGVPVYIAVADSVITAQAEVKREVA